MPFRLVLPRHTADARKQWSHSNGATAFSVVYLADEHFVNVDTAASGAVQYGRPFFSTCGVQCEEHAFRQCDTSCFDRLLVTSQSLHSFVPASPPTFMIHALSLLHWLRVSQSRAKMATTLTDRAVSPSHVRRTDWSADKGRVGGHRQHSNKSAHTGSYRHHLRVDSDVGG